MQQNDNDFLLYSKCDSNWYYYDAGAYQGALSIANTEANTEAVWNRCLELLKSERIWQHDFEQGKTDKPHSELYYLKITGYTVELDSICFHAEDGRDVYIMLTNQVPHQLGFKVFVNRDYMNTCLNKK